MKSYKRAILIFTIAFRACVSLNAGESAVAIIYQPIIDNSEEPSKGFTILPTPFWWFHAGGTSPYFAITQRNEILTDAPRSERVPDHNLLSSAGVVIAGSFTDGSVYMRFENLRIPTYIGDTVTLDDIAEAAFECVRRVACDTKKRPKLIISGKKGEESKWQAWQNAFEQNDIATPFKRPTEEANNKGGADQPATAPQLKSEGKEKPEPEAEARPE